LSRLANDTRGGGTLEASSCASLVFPARAESAVALIGASIFSGVSFPNTFSSVITSLRGTYVQGEIGDRWRKLCEQAAAEQDPNKLMDLVHEINILLEEKEMRLKQERSQKRGAA
jgi:hypothetical protein